MIKIDQRLHTLPNLVKNISFCSSLAVELCAQTNGKRSLFYLICIRFGTSEAPRLQEALCLDIVQPL